MWGPGSSNNRTICSHSKLASVRDTQRHRHTCILSHQQKNTSCYTHKHTLSLYTFIHVSPYTPSQWFSVRATSSSYRDVSRTLSEHLKSFLAARIQHSNQHRRRELRASLQCHLLAREVSAPCPKGRTQDTLSQVPFPAKLLVMGPMVFLILLLFLLILLLFLLILVFCWRQVRSWPPWNRTTASVRDHQRPCKPEGKQWSSRAVSKPGSNFHATSIWDRLPEMLPAVSEATPGLCKGDYHDGMVTCNHDSR